MEAIKPEIDPRKTDVGTKRIGLNRAEPQGLILESVEDSRILSRLLGYL
jgi:hypothetical protein